MKSIHIQKSHKLHDEAVAHAISHLFQKFCSFLNLGTKENCECAVSDYLAKGYNLHNQEIKSMIQSRLPLSRPSFKTHTQVPHHVGH